jgi:hypothetical protein
MSGDNRAERGGWVVLGGIRLLNQTAPRRPDEPIVLVRVAPQEVCLPSVRGRFYRGRGPVGSTAQSQVREAPMLGPSRCGYRAWNLSSRSAMCSVRRPIR